MAKCINCGKESGLISKTLGVCLDCVRKDFDAVLPHIKKVHSETRKRFELPYFPPETPDGAKCNFCFNQCQIGEEETGYCGLRKNKGGKLKGGRAEDGHLSWYYDNLPTNCVADWVCPGGTKAGYPEFSYSKGVEYGYKNLAVFYQSCSFNCLFCQNWHFRNGIKSSVKTTAQQLANCVDEKTSCICYFGGDPSTQIIHSIKTSNLALENKKTKILRICWETNGSMNQKYLKKIAEISLKSGGCIKFDLKAHDEKLNLALCGVSNKQTLENFKFLADYFKKRPDPPFLVASTLLVPGYVDSEEVLRIAKFIASLNPEIPYSLLAFYPCFYMMDLPKTSKNHALECKEKAESCGLLKVKVGNVRLLSDAY
ncbi:MAG: pyruvate formate lyase-activating protein [candidate division Zixibacteria bacterium SM23_73_2]|nr:MAG: pyruvate formate lyase-activating protein [candidate division Zixibacteria bacterium SM23_73_2]